MDNAKPKLPRFRPLIQPAIVRLYRAAGIVALSAILIGLICFLTVTIFYFFNRTWVRPVIIGPEHAKVVEVSHALHDEQARKDELEADRASATYELTQIGRTITADTDWEAAAAPTLTAPGAGPKSAETLLVLREHTKSELERAAATDRKALLEMRIKGLDERIGEEDKVINRLAASPYLRATEERKVVAFVPYQNLSNVRPGVFLYGCAWGLVRCHRVGKVVSLLEGEVQDVHPHDDSVQRGVMVEIELTDPQAAEENVLFAGSKPFWWL